MSAGPGPVDGSSAWLNVVHLAAPGPGQQLAQRELIAARIHGVALLSHTVAALAAAGSRTVVCVPAELVGSAGRLVGDRAEVRAGAADRVAAVREVLGTVGPETVRILVHDGDRALLSSAVVAAVRAAIESGAAAALPVLDVPETIKQVDRRHRIVSTVDRTRLRRAQTPQAFRRDVLEAVLAGLPATTTAAGDSTGSGEDLAALVAAAGQPVTFVPGDERLLRIRSESDLAIAEALMSTSRGLSDAESPGAR